MLSIFNFEVSRNIFWLIWLYFLLYAAQHQFSHMKTNEREIQIYYNPENSSDRKCVAHAKSMAQHIKAFAFDKTPSSITSWRQILKNLECHPKELMDKSKPYYQEHIRGRDFTMNGWLDIVARNPGLIKSPIAMRGSRAILCKQPTDIYRLT